MRSVALGLAAISFLATCSNPTCFCMAKINVNAKTLMSSQAGHQDASRLRSVNVFEGAKKTFRMRCMAESFWASAGAGTVEVPIQSSRERFYDGEFYYVVSGWLGNNSVPETGIQWPNPRSEGDQFKP